MLAVMALLVLLTGCGQTADSEPPEPENVPDVPAQEEPAPPEPVLPEELQAALERAGVSAEDIAGRQLIVVCADGDAGQLLRFEADGQLVWTQVGDAVEAPEGQNGVSREKTEGDRKTRSGYRVLHSCDRARRSRHRPRATSSVRCEPVATTDCTDRCTRSRPQ